LLVYKKTRIFVLAADLVQFDNYNVVGFT